MRRIAIASFLTLLLSAHGASAMAPDGSFFVGYNQPWFKGQYGEDLTTKFDPEFVSKMFVGIRSAGGTVARIFLFTKLQGISYPGGVAGGVSSQFLGNLETLLKIARQSRIKIYVTPLQVGEANQVQGEWRQFYVNIIQDAKANEQYLQKVLAPVLEVLGRHQDVVFGLDLANEIDALLHKGFTNPFQVRSWVASSAEFVKRHSPWLKKTVSVGWGGAQYILGFGLMSGLGLDFYDIHVYSDTGDYSGVTRICERAQSEGLPVILGEFGQKSQTVDDKLQASVTRRFLEIAFSKCFSGALAWDFDDPVQPWFSFRKPDNTLRPAAEVIKNFPRYGGSPK